MEKDKELFRTEINTKIPSIIFIFIVMCSIATWAYFTWSPWPTSISGCVFSAFFLVVSVAFAVKSGRNGVIIYQRKLDIINKGVVEEILFSDIAKTSVDPGGPSMPNGPMSFHRIIFEMKDGSKKYIGEHNVPTSSISAVYGHLKDCGVPV